MKNQDLLVYIKNRLDNGISREKIILDLENVGWEKKDIDEAFQAHEEGVPIQRSGKINLGKTITAVMTIVPVIIILGFIFVLIIEVNDNGRSHSASSPRIQSNLKTVNVQAELAWDDSELVWGTGNYNAVCGANGIQQDMTIRAAIEVADEDRKSVV